VARFHAALDDLPHVFVALRSGVHDTSRHLASLRQALRDHPSHRLQLEVAGLAADLFAAIDRLPPLPAEPPRVCHGDLKVSNVLFAGAEAGERDRALCLIDLDTLGPLPLAYELGDAWRSWCNPSREDEAEPDFDLGLFEASWGGYRDALRTTLDETSRRGLLGGEEWITAELAARFAADALRECYFGFDPARYPAAGEHNLVRARGQWALHRSARATHAARAAILELHG
jgi:aminoglycoside phosphotransferase (APT) family kinase protein